MSYTRDSELDLVYNSETDSYEPVLQEYVLTINPTPSDATVVLTATGFEQEGNSITVNSGTTVSYVISKTGYKTVSDEITVTEDQTLAISLVVDNVIHIQHLRGTTSQINDYTGREGEITYDTITHALRVHDGIKKGGYEIGGSSSSDYHPDLFDYKWADHILNDASWLRSDTFSWQSGAVYQAAYQHLADEFEFKEFSTATENTNLGSKYWRDIAWDGTKFVALGSEGYVSTSTDGTTWTEAVQNTNLGSKYWQDITWDGTKFVALGSEGYVSTSTDGVNWTSAIENTNLEFCDWSALAWDGTKFIALDFEGYISTSTDGVNWTKAIHYTNLGSNEWNALAWDGTKFVALGNEGYISTSTDGTTWTEAVQSTDLGSNEWNTLAWDGTKFVALSNTGYVSTSTDGVNWTIATQNASLGNNSWNTLAWDGTKFVALGNTGYVSTGNLNTETETIAGVTITYCQTPDGHKLVSPDQESNVTAIYNATGVAWYYIIDTTNQRFKLPRAKKKEYITNLSVYGRTQQLTGNIGSSAQLLASGTWSSGGIASGGAQTNRAATSDVQKIVDAYAKLEYTTDSDQYKYLYFYVGQFTQTALENTAGLNAELFNNKVDLTSSWGAPTSTHDVLTLAASGTYYTAPADGYVELVKFSTAAGQQIILANETAGINVCNIATASGYGLGAFLPCKKGDSFNVQYNTAGTTSKFWFIYTQKSN